VGAQKPVIDTNNTKYISCIMKTITSIKLDKDVKEEASTLAAELGLNLSVVVNATLKKFVIERRVTFSVEPELNTQTQKIFLKIMDDIKKGKSLVGPFDNIEDLKKSLEA